MSIGLLMALTRPGSAQQRGARPALLPLMGCGVHGDVEVLCGTRQPENLELTPDGKYLIATQFLNAGRGAPTGGGMALFDLALHLLGRFPGRSVGQDRVPEVRSARCDASRENATGPYRPPSPLLEPRWPLSL
jgi:hypothetical protein